MGQLDKYFLQEIEEGHIITDTHTHTRIHIQTEGVSFCLLPKVQNPNLDICLGFYEFLNIIFSIGPVNTQSINVFIKQWHIHQS